AARDVFFGPAVAERRGEMVEVARHVYLTDIVRNERRADAYLYDRYNNEWTHLRASAAFDSFRVVGGDGRTRVDGRVVRVDERDVIFQADAKFYAIHVGQTLEEALARPLPPEEVKARGLARGP